MMTGTVYLAQEAIDRAALLRDCEDAAMGAGALASFTGLARGRSKDGTPVSQLVLEHYRGVTLASMQAIADDAAARFALSHAHVTHRSGTMAPGEPIVFVVAAALHRADALLAVAYMMDRLKTEAVFWKYEDGPEGKHWIEPGEQDYAARQKWDEHGRD